jgi:subfamily B ATP-binding cassette protein MsbA
LTLATAIFEGFTFALIIPFLRTLFGETALPSSGTAVEEVLERVVGPWLTAGTPGTAIRNVVVVVLIAVALKNLTAYGAAYLSVVMQEGLVRDLRVAVYRHIQRQDLGFFHRTRGGQLVSRVVADADQTRHLVTGIMNSLLINGALIAVYLAILLSLSWKLSLLSLLLAPVLVLGIRPVLSRLRVQGRRWLEERGELTSVLTETVSGAKLVKAHGGERYEAHRFGVAADRSRKGALRAQRFALLASPLSETFGAVVTVLVLTFGTSLAMGPSASLRPETLIAFLAVTLRLMSPVKSLTQMPTLFETALVAADRMFEILDLPSAEEDAPDARPLDRFERALVYEQVWFAYEENEWVLRDISFTAERGQVIAIVGPSGAGKSTLVDLLPRFYDPGRGRITIDGIDLQAVRRTSLRRLLGIVSQETVIFNDSVRRNIAYGHDGELDDAAVEAAARAANAHEFILMLPQGYDTVLGERGARLSGGQRQRIAIARALYRDPPILIFDEATSALDSESERQVQEAIERLLMGRTVLVIAHRLSTIRHASEILVLDGGGIVERGRHDDLLLRNGLYARLHAVQFGAVAAS